MTKRWTKFFLSIRSQWANILGKNVLSSHIASMTKVYAVVYYLDGHMRMTQKTLYGLYESAVVAKKAQQELCGGATTPYINNCVRGRDNGVVSWICNVDLNTPIQWTLAVAGPHH